MGVLPSSIETTEDMDGRRLGEGSAQVRARASIFSASSEEKLFPRVGSTSSIRAPLPCKAYAWRTYIFHGY